MINYTGQTVKVLVDKANNAHHPTEDRFVKSGDLIVIKAVNSGGGLLVFDIDPKFKVISTRENGPNTQQIEKRFVELIPNPWEGLVSLKELHECF